MARTERPDLNIGRTIVRRIDGRLLLLCRTAQGWRAADAVCPHQGRIMDGARVIGDAVVCPWHGARFGMDDGHCRSPELTRNCLPIHHCEEVGDELVITFD